MNEQLRRGINDVLANTYTREVCQQHVDQLQERIELLEHPLPEKLATVITQGIALNKRALSHCRELYPGEFGLWEVQKHDSSKQ